MKYSTNGKFAQRVMNGKGFLGLGLIAGTPLQLDGGARGDLANRHARYGD